MQISEANSSENYVKEETIPLEERIMKHHKEQLSQVRRQLNMGPVKEEESGDKKKDAEKRKNEMVESLRNIKYRSGLVASMLETIKKNHKQRTYAYSEQFQETQSESKMLGWKCFEGSDGKLGKPEFAKCYSMNDFYHPNFVKRNFDC